MKKNNLNKQNMKKNNLINECGFSMIETLVAIFILLISITGPMVFAQSSLRAAFQSRDQITAYFLAQDVIEFIKNTREDIAITNIRDQAGSIDWIDDLETTCDTTNGCTIDTNYLVKSNDAVRSCNTSNPGCLNDPDNPLKIDNDGYFGFNGSIDSKFHRTVYIDEKVPDREAQIVVKIRWTSHDTIGERVITVAENIYNWSEPLVN